MNIGWVTIIGLIAGACTTVSILPQVIKTIKIKETKDISLLMYIILILGLLLWTIYGILNKDVPIILANVFTLIFASIVLILKIKHG